MSAGRTACCVVPLLLGATGALLAVSAVRFGGDPGKAWAVTYTAGASGSGTYTAAYQDTEGRYPWQDTGLREHTEAGLSGTWRQDVVIVDGKKAKVSVTPAEGAVATCKIFLDGRTLLAEGASPAPGRPAVCESAIGP
ncbi:hypothetical protein ABZY44_32695 [Streptomyces sp. NPDC006544]|uniref:hypothetical protein n=1 Tax=Streptomyces sp. NPDC006544 TaxID=3154583 RepID=UPI0033B28D63